jgi:hypothetical protein
MVVLLSDILFLRFIVQTHFSVSTNLVFEKCKVRISTSYLLFVGIYICISL